jgi:hypothetical protein
VRLRHRFVLDAELVTGDGSMESFYGVVQHSLDVAVAPR